jgi:hypothetical protein
LELISPPRAGTREVWFVRLWIEGLRGTNVKRRPPSGNLGRFGSIRGARSTTLGNRGGMGVLPDCFPSCTLKGGNVGRTMENTGGEARTTEGASSARTSAQHSPEGGFTLRSPHRPLNTLQLPCMPW